MVARFLHMAKQLTRLALIGSESEGKVTSYIRYFCALNLHKTSKMLASGWTFSMVMDMFTRISILYMNIRIRLFACGAIHNFHLHDILMFSSHTGEEIFLHSERALDAIFPNWRDLISSISTESERR